MQATHHTLGVTGVTHHSPVVVTRATHMLGVSNRASTMLLARPSTMTKTMKSARPATTLPLQTWQLPVSYHQPRMRTMTRAQAASVAAAPSAPSTSQQEAPPPISRLLVLNAGSSSLKFKLFDQAGATLVPGVGGVCERIGDAANSTLVTKAPTADGKVDKQEVHVPALDHAAAMSHVLDFLTKTVSKTVREEIHAVGHRIVHGLDISEPALLTDSVIDTITRAAVLAPLHNPAALLGISAVVSVLGESVAQVAVFDTAYHQTMPPKAYMYGLPYELYEKHHIRRYGFHGTSHQFLAQQAASMLNVPLNNLNAISCHLGAGASIAAIKGGKSVDTTMGMTPLEGLLMASRCGDLDPAVVLHLQATLGLTPQEVDTLMNKQSGLQGLCGASDVREVCDMKAAGDPKAALALDMLVYRVRKYIGAYSAVLDGEVHALLFSAGIGENSAVVRGLICQGLEGFGISVCPEANAAAMGVQADISGPGAKVCVLVVPTDEELGIAQQTAQLIADTKVLTAGHP